MMPLLILNLAGFIAISILLWHCWSEWRTLRAIVHRSVPKGESTFATALDFAGLVHAHAPRSEDPRFIPIAALDILGGSPISILRRGGCCSGLCRLCITGLRTLGIKAAQVTLYHTDGQAQHALVEVSLKEQAAIVDPLYGFYYVDSHGRPMTIETLRRGVKPEYRPLPLSSSVVYPANNYYNVDFSRTKTANWSKTRVRRSAYRILRTLTVGRIDTLRQPLWLEWPQLVLAAGIILGVLTFNVAMLFLYRAFSFGA